MLNEASMKYLSLVAEIPKGNIFSAFNSLLWIVPFGEMNKQFEPYRQISDPSWRWAHVY